MDDDELLFVRAINCQSGTWHEKFLAALNALKAAGWQRVGPDQVVVPVEPTEAMLSAAEREEGNQFMVKENLSHEEVYRAMIAAVPMKQSKE